MNTNNLKRFAKEARIKLLDQVGQKLRFVLTQDNAELRGKEKEIDQLKKKITEQGKEQVIEMVAYTWFNRLVGLRFMDANNYNIPKVITPSEGMTSPEILQNALGGNIESNLKLDRQRLNDLLDGKTAATDAYTEAYKMLLVASCNQWYAAMPFMFERISDYTELLLPDDLLSDYSIVADIRKGMTNEDCQQEEIIGWLYQFYIGDKKDSVFEGLKKNIKITAENIPAATQLFTPRWIVRYMVENTLGKLWLTLKPNSKLRDHMPYFIEAPEGNLPAPVPEDLLTTDNEKLITKITFLDPCQGSGHILVYAFDLFTKIYEEEGYNTNEIPALILEHNLFGIDIDQRAAQLAAFALSMKARSYHSRFLRNPVQPNVFALENCNFNQEEIIKLVAKGLVSYFEDLYDRNFKEAQSSLFKILVERAKKAKKTLPPDTFKILKKKLYSFTQEPFILNYLKVNEKQKTTFELEDIQNDPIFTNWIGSLCDYKAVDLKSKIELFNQLENIGSLFLPNTEIIELIIELETQLSANDFFENNSKIKLLKAIEQAEYLSRQYHCVVTNPPYMNSGGMNPEINSFVESYYSTSKSDLYACFIERCLDFLSQKGLTSIINQHGWMFLSSFENLRYNILKEYSIISVLHLGPRTFPEISGEVVQNVAFVLSKLIPNQYSIPSFFRLVKLRNTESKRLNFISAVNKENHLEYKVNQNFFLELPGFGFGYWLKKNIVNLLNQEEKLSTHFYSDGKNVTGSNERYLKFHWEVSRTKVDRSIKWFLLAKGGTGRKWYGNIEHVIDWSESARVHYRKSKIGRIIPEYLWSKQGITWSKISSGLPTFRYRPENVTFDEVQITTDNIDYIEPALGLLNSKFAANVLEFFNPTLSIQIKDILNIPVNMQTISNDEELIFSIKQNSKLAIMDWDRREESFNFKTPLISISKVPLKKEYSYLANTITTTLKEWFKNDQNINERIHLALYGKKDDHFSLIPDDITILDDIIELDTNVEEIASIEDLKYQISESKITIQLVSYITGCFFGRYSLDKPALILANQGETLQDFLSQVPNPTFIPDDDNIIPVLEGEWFTDDIVGRFKVFLKAAFGEEHFEENLKFIEDTIGKDIRKYFVKDFYNDHIKRYKKRPIYWMFASPKGHFKALIYMHRYQPDLCSIMLNDYLQAFISKLESAKQTQTMLSLKEDKDISTRERTLANKEIDKFEAMLKDCRDYQKTLFIIATQKISIDLDDGVKVNYQKFKEVLIPIKGLEKEEE